MTKARSNATANAAKGDLTVGNGTNLSGVLAVGSNGDTIVADSSTATGLRYQGNFAAGKNKIINGDFGIWQRGTSFSLNASAAYTADRWYANCANTVTVSQQTFTPGTAPVAGYEGQFFYRINRTARPTAFDDYFIQRIEDVRTFAGQTVIMSFWAKTNSGTVTLSGGYIEQNFGSGGSSAVYTGGTPALTLTTSWQRFSAVVTMPSIAGKTIGTNSFVTFNFAMANSVGTTAVYDIWGCQLEAGSVATAFQTATGTIQGELAACQRYYQKTYIASVTPGTSTQNGLVNYISSTSTAVNNRCWVPFTTSMRTASPTITTYSATGVVNTATNEVNGDYNIAIQFQSENSFTLYPTSGTFAAGQVCNFHYVASAEL